MRAWLPVAVILLLAGCAESPPPTNETPMEATAETDPWDGVERQVLLEVNAGAGSFQLDVLCVFGGGIQLEREGRGRVLAGADHVAITVTAPPETTGLQIGHVLASDPEYDERLQTGITWLDPVRAGTRTFEVPVPANGFESLDGDRLWRFYQRVNTPVVEQDCYTGFLAGAWSVLAEAVKGST